ncbi:ferric reductase [Methanosarcina horonobensis]|uniref:ferric reductase n=1 Tax=Methanosarcina horonobensis TaxID=418008 RepID=UPI0022B93DE3|nr:ferric reductase [Methanosarcina horonobensis]
MSKDADGKEKGHKSDKGMSDKKISNKKFYLIYGIILVIVLFIAYLLLQRPGEPLRMVARFAATFGYLTIFLSILSSEYMAKMRKISGLPFLKAHHHLARIGILLILIHPLALAIGGQGFRIFLPEFYPVNRFLMFGGKTAIYLFLLAAALPCTGKSIETGRRYITSVTWLFYLSQLMLY